MAISFKLSKHSHRQGITVVEVLVEGVVAGVIYPEGEKTIKLVSAHIAGEVVHDDGSTSWPPIPTVFVTFEPSPYEIRGGKIVKLKTH